MVRATRGARHGLAIVVAGLAACGSSDAPSAPSRQGALAGQVSGHRFTVLALQGMTQRSAPDLEELILAQGDDWPVHVAIDWSTPQDARDRLFVMRGDSAAMRFEQLGRDGARIAQTVRPSDMDPHAIYDLRVADDDLGYVASAPDPTEPGVMRVIAFIAESWRGGFDCKARLAPRDEHDARQTVEAVAAMCRSIRAVDEPAPRPVPPPTLARSPAEPTHRQPFEPPPEVPVITFPGEGEDCWCGPAPREVAACRLALQRLGDLRRCATAHWTTPPEDLADRVAAHLNRAFDDREQFARSALACWEIAKMLGDQADDDGCVLAPVTLTPRVARPRR